MTHLGSEEYEPDARVFETKPLEPMNLYRGTLGKVWNDGGANPYRYGHMVEVAVKGDGSSTATKHYSMGRLAFELGDVMGAHLQQSSRAENTGLNVFDDYNGHAYITANIQHPGQPRISPSILTRSRSACAASSTSAAMSATWAPYRH